MTRIPTRNARRQFAQIYTVQDALQGGQVDPQAIGNVHQKYPNLLTGNLRLIGSAAQELPADMRLPTESTDGALDAILDKTKGIAGSLIRPLMRSDMVQNQVTFQPTINTISEFKIDNSNSKFFSSVYLKSNAAVRLLTAASRVPNGLMLQRVSMNFRIDVVSYCV